MKSMTGFGQASQQINGVTIEVSVRSVNGRFLEIRPHISKKYLSFESDISQLIKKYLSRGTCDIYIQRVSGGTSEVAFSFQNQIAKKWLTEFRKSLKELKMPDTIAAKDLLAIPDFVQVQEAQEIGDKEKAAVLNTVEKALQACLAERLREGQSLQKICLSHIKNLRERLAQFKKLREDILHEIPQKISERLQKALKGQFEVDPTRLLQEVAFISERSDIEEELQRLDEHLKNVEALVRDDKAQGKKLDFYAQELLREVNTIGSKSASAKIVETVVDSKNLVEQFREQVQNIE